MGKRQTKQRWKHQLENRLLLISVTMKDSGHVENIYHTKCCAISGRHKLVNLEKASENSLQAF